MDNNQLTYILTTPNLDAMGQRMVGVLASFKFALEYQKGADNEAADALSQVPICHNCEMVWPLMEGAIVVAMGEASSKVGTNAHGCLERSPGGGHCAGCL